MKPTMKLNIDFDAVMAAFGELSKEMQIALDIGAETLASTAYAHITEELANQSPSIQRIYTEALERPYQETQGVYVIALNPEAFWIEEGIKPDSDMKTWLLNSKKAKNGRNGRYLIVPFKHSEKPTRMSSKQQALATDIKQNLKDAFKGINAANRDTARKAGTEKPVSLAVNKIELVDPRNPTSSPRTGSIHSFNFGGEIPGKGNTPIKDGVTIHQKDHQDGKGVRRDIFTFRTVTQNSSKWKHPGFKRLQLLDNALEFAQKTWDDRIFPEIMKRFE